MTIQQMYRHHNRLCILAIGNTFAAGLLWLGGAWIFWSEPFGAVALWIIAWTINSRARHYARLADAALEVIARGRAP